MSVNVSVDAPRRVACPRCGTMILSGARKCRGCKQWLVDPPKSGMRSSRSLTLVVAAVVAVAAVLISTRDSPVGEAPPLTPIASGSAVAEADMAGELAPGTDAETGETRIPEPLEPNRPGNRDWHARQLQLDVHPLDVAFSPNGKTLYVSGDDATLREYELERGKLLHMASVPAQGDRIRVLHGRYVAIIRKYDAAHIPVMDIENWDRDPMLLWVGGNPADIVALPDGKTAIAASSTGKRLTWFDLTTNRRKGNIRLPHLTKQLYVLADGDRSYVGAQGMMYRGGRATGAFIDLFDPTEKPFGATRRSISVGRDPRPGAVTADRSRLVFTDYVSNTATLLRVNETTERKSLTVGQGPVAAFLLNDDKHGVTLDSKARSVTVLDVNAMERVTTLMLDGVPAHGATSPDRKTLFVSLGGDSWPPRAKGAVVISGDPPKVVANIDTGRGASRIAVTPSGRRAVVANYVDKTLTIIESK